LEDMRSTIREMTDEQIAERKAGLIQDWTQKLKNLKEESQRFWAHISAGYLDFRRSAYIREPRAYDSEITAFPPTTTRVQRCRAPAHDHEARNRRLFRAICRPCVNLAFKVLCASKTSNLSTRRWCRRRSRAFER
jgi:hypothetical protein